MEKLITKLMATITVLSILLWVFQLKELTIGGILSCTLLGLLSALPFIIIGLLAQYLISKKDAQKD